jgi:hypothetical protein
VCGFVGPARCVGFVRLAVRLTGLVRWSRIRVGGLSVPWSACLPPTTCPFRCRSACLSTVRPPVPAGQPVCRLVSRVICPLGRPRSCAAVGVQWILRGVGRPGGNRCPTSAGRCEPWAMILVGTARRDGEVRTRSRRAAVSAQDLRGSLQGPAGWMQARVRGGCGRCGVVGVRRAVWRVAAVGGGMRLYGSGLCGGRPCAGAADGMWRVGVSSRVGRWARGGGGCPPRCGCGRFGRWSGSAGVAGGSAGGVGAGRGVGAAGLAGGVGPLVWPVGCVAAGATVAGGRSRRSGIGRNAGAASCPGAVSVRPACAGLVSPPGPALRGPLR